MVARRIGEGSSGLAAAEGGRKKKSDPLMMSGLNADAVAERVAERNPPKEPPLSAKVAAMKEAAEKEIHTGTPRGSPTPALAVNSPRTHTWDS